MQATINEILKEYEERGEYVPVYTAPSFSQPNPANSNTKSSISPGTNFPPPPRIFFCNLAFPFLNLPPGMSMPPMPSLPPIPGMPFPRPPMFFPPGSNLADVQNSPFSRAGHFDHQNQTQGNL